MSRAGGTQASPLRQQEPGSGLFCCVGHCAVPCGGRIDPRYLLKALESGAEAVCVFTCARGHCKRMEGNLRATRRIDAVRELIAEAGADPETVQIFLPADSDRMSIEAATENLARFVESRRSDAQKVTVA